MKTVSRESSLGPYVRLNSSRDSPIFVPPDQPAARCARRRSTQASASPTTTLASGETVCSVALTAPATDTAKVNVKAPLSMIRTALPYLRRSGAGRIVNVVSIAGKAVYNNNAGYAMTKFAAVALSHAARRAGWEDGVRCTALCPGFVATDMTADVETFPHEQMMAPGDIAEVVLTVLGLSNSASIAELVINCRDDVTM